MIFYIRERVLEVLQHSYPEHYQQYSKSLMFNLSFKEGKKNGSYSYEKKTITINNLSHSPGDILISTLISLSEHIDIIIRKETHLDRELLMITRKLLSVAIERNLITINDLKLMTDEKYKAALQENFSSFSNWTEQALQIDIPYYYIYVYESFMIQNILKANQYHYDPNQGHWYKRITCNDIDNEREFISKYKEQAEFIIKAKNEFYIRPIYLIKFKTYSAEDAPLLRALDYIYNKRINIWTKLCPAANILQEKENILNIPSQFFSFTANKSK